MNSDAWAHVKQPYQRRDTMNINRTEETRRLYEARNKRRARVERQWKALGLAVTALLWGAIAWGIWP